MFYVSYILQLRLVQFEHRIYVVCALFSKAPKQSIYVVFLKVFYYFLEKMSVTVAPREYCLMGVEEEQENVVCTDEVSNYFTLKL